MLLPDGWSLERAGIVPDLVVRLDHVPKTVTLWISPWWYRVLLVLTDEQQHELGDDGLVLVPVWDHAARTITVALTYAADYH